MIGELLQTGSTYGTGRKAINNAFSGVASFNVVTSNITYGTVISGDTLYSGATDLSLLFAPISVATGSSPFSGNTVNKAIVPIFGSNIASGAWSFVAGGSGSTASGALSHAQGGRVLASGTYSHAEGRQTSATTNGAHAEGYRTRASGTYSHAEGSQTLTSGNYAHAEGNLTSATTTNSHAEGLQTLASGARSHAEGQLSIASGVNSHAEGNATLASSNNTHAEGGSTTASANSAHAEGYATTASGNYSHSQGFQTIASGRMTHAGGSGSTASGNAAFIHSTRSTVVAPNSAILGGFLNRLNAAATGSTILGGSNITGNTADTVYVPILTATTAIYADTLNYITSVSSIPSNNTIYSEKKTQTTTTNTTPTSISFTNINIRGSVTYDILLTATQIAGASGTTKDSKFWLIKALITCDGIGNSTLVIDTTSTVGGSAGASTWTASSPYGGFPVSPLTIDINGQVGKTIVWQAVARIATIYF